MYVFSGLYKSVLNYRTCIITQKMWHHLVWSLYSCHIFQLGIYFKKTKILRPSNKVSYNYRKQSKFMCHEAFIITEDYQISLESVMSISILWQSYTVCLKISLAMMKKQYVIWFIAFTVTKFNEVFSGNQPHLVAIKKVLITILVLIISIMRKPPMQRIAHEYFTETAHCNTTVFSKN